MRRMLWATVSVAAIVSAASATSGVAALASPATAQTATVQAPPQPRAPAGSAGRAPAPVLAAGADPVIILAGDVACSPKDPGFNKGAGRPGRCHMKMTAGLAAAANPAAVLALGDTQYENGGRADFTASYDKSWGAFKSITRPTVGNHEYGTSGASGYFSYFGSAAGTRSKGYYSFNVGRWHVVSINTECAQLRGGSGCATGSAQASWLRSDLAANPTACTLVFGHRPRWSSNSFASAEISPLISVMQNAGVDIYAAGHSHTYERFAPQTPSGAASNNGITQLVVGTGGSYFTGFASTARNSKVRRSSVFGVLKLTLHPTGYDYQYIADPSTPFTDKGSGTCR
jgi:hypothetical protein